MGDTGEIILLASVHTSYRFQFSSQVHGDFDISDTMSDGNITVYLFNVT